MDGYGRAKVPLVSFLEAAFVLLHDLPTWRVEDAGAYSQRPFVSNGMQFLKVFFLLYKTTKICQDCHEFDVDSEDLDEELIDALEEVIKPGGDVWRDPSAATDAICGYSVPICFPNKSNNFQPFLR